MLISFKRGQTSIILRLFIADATTGAGKTGLAYNTTGLVISTITDNEASTTNYTAAGSTIETISTLGTFATPSSSKCRFKEVDATNWPGLYELQVVNARYAVTGAKSLAITIHGVSGVAQTPVMIPLWDVDPYSSSTFGLSYLGTPTQDIAAAVAAIPTTAPATPSIIQPAGVISQNVAIAAYPIRAVGSSDGLPKRLAVAAVDRVDQIVGPQGSNAGGVCDFTVDGTPAYTILDGGTAADIETGINGALGAGSVSIVLDDVDDLPAGGSATITWGGDYAGADGPATVTITNNSLAFPYSVSNVTPPAAAISGIDGSTFAASYSFGTVETTFAPSVAEIAQGLFSVSIPAAATNTAVGGLWKFTATDMQTVLVPFSTTQIEIHNSRPPVTTSNTVAATVVGTPACTLTAAYDPAKYAAHNSQAAAILAAVGTLPTTAPDNASITAIKAKTDNLPADPAREATVNAVGAAVVLRPTVQAIWEYATRTLTDGGTSIDPQDIRDAMALAVTEGTPLAVGSVDAMLEAISAKTALIGVVQVPALTVLDATQAIQLTRGDDYTALTGRVLEWELAESWPVPDAATFTLRKASDDSLLLSVDCDLDGRTITAELTSEDTADLPTGYAVAVADLECSITSGQNTGKFTPYIVAVTIVADVTRPESA